MSKTTLKWYLFEIVQIVFFTNDIFDTSQNNLLFNFLPSHGEKADHLEIGQDHKTLVAALETCR